jgi:hypothetical protein
MCYTYTNNLNCKFAVWIFGLTNSKILLMNTNKQKYYCRLGLDVDVVLSLPVPVIIAPIRS